MRVEGLFIFTFLSISNHSTNGIEEASDYLLFCIEKAGNNES